MSSKSSLYRKKVKESNDGKHEEYLRKMRERAQRKRDEEKLRRAQEPQTRAMEMKQAARLEQMREYRARKRAEAGIQTRGSLPVRVRDPNAKKPCDMTVEEMRLHANRLRQESRARMSAQKRCRHREKDRAYQKRKRDSLRGMVSPSVVTPHMNIEMAMRQDSMEGLELTEKIVLTRTRAPDLDSVRKLNCWASNINDVSVVRRIPNLEVCSLTINRITSLRDFAHCHKLKELYVRTNKISCLGDIHYLKNLSRLRSLWLSENPCADTKDYRLIVLRTLPHLQKLDNTAVTPEEVQEALNLEEISVPQDFSASSLFHPGITESSVSSLSSIDSRFHKESTDTSVSYECLPIARKKREQRRLKKASEELSRRSSEEESPRTEEESDKTSSGEIIKKEKTDSTSDDVCSEDDFKRAMEIDEKEEEKDDDVNVSLESGVLSLVNSNPSKVSPGEEIEGRSKNSNQTSLSNHISDGSSTSDSQESCGSRLSDNAADDGGGGGCGEKGSNHSNNYKEDKRENNATDDNNGHGNNSNANDADSRIDLENIDSSVDECMDESNGNDIDVEKKESKMAGDSLLDKICLDDSLALDEVADVHDSIELDDLIIEVEGEKQSASNTDNDKNNNRKSNDEEQHSIEQVLKDHVKLEEVSSSTSTLPTLTNRSVSPPTASAASPRTRPTDPAGAQNMGNNKDERLSKMESVDWDEYNRMRQDLGMRPMEKVSASKTVNSEITRVRNANILQAVLSLVKELDKDSLDLVATAVKARRDNL